MTEGPAYEGEPGLSLTRSVVGVNPARRLVVLSALRWVPAGLVIPVLVLMLGARGLSLAQTGQMMALYSVVTLSLELPTGGLADAWGRRPVIVASAVLQALSLLILGVLGSVPFIMLAMVLMGTSRALSSGPVEAWYVDAMHGLGHEDVESGLAHGQIAESLALGGAAVIGGLLPRAASGLPSTGTGVITLSVPFLVAAVAALVHAVVAALLLTGEKSARGSVRQTVGQAVGIAVKQPPIRRLMIVAACLGLVLAGVELLAPNRFAELAGSANAGAALFGFLTAAAFAAAAVGAAISTRLPGARALVGAAAFLVMGVLVLGLALAVVGGAAAAYLLLYVAIGVQGPVMAGLLHARVTSEVRSTMMSVESLALQAGGAVSSVIVGAIVSRINLLAGLSVVTATAVLAAVLLVRDRRHAV